MRQQNSEINNSEYTLILPKELTGQATIQESSTEVQSSHPIDYAVENPIAATSWVVGAIAVGLVLRSIVTRPKV